MKILDEVLPMNPLLNEYERHYIEAHKSAHEAIKQLNTFGEHYSQLSDNDKRKLFEQVIVEKSLSDYFAQLWQFICYRVLG